MQVGVASPIPSHDIGDGRKPLQYLHLHIDVPAGGEKVLRDRGAGISLGDGVDQEWWCRRMAYRSFATTRSIVGSPPLRRSRLISNAREPAISPAIPLFDRRATTPGQQIRTDADGRAGEQARKMRQFGTGPFPVFLGHQPITAPLQHIDSRRLLVMSVWRGVQIGSNSRMQATSGNTVMKSRPASIPRTSDVRMVMHYCITVLFGV
jgi:hypothetical protein